MMKTILRQIHISHVAIYVFIYVYSSTAENSPQQTQNMLLFEERLIKPTMLICSSKRSKLFTAREGKSQHLLTCGQINDGFWYFMGVVDSKMKPLPSVVTDAQ